MSVPLGSTESIGVVSLGNTFVTCTVNQWPEWQGGFFYRCGEGEEFLWGLGLGS